MNTILIIEDEEKLSQILSLYLKHEGFSVSTANNGTQGLELAINEDFSLIILDLMLPGISGEEIIKELRKHKNTPVLMLTAKSSEQDRIAGFLDGADDYVSKPANPNEIVLRVKAILKRSSNNASDFLTFNEINLDKKRFIVTVNSKKIDLTKAEFNILAKLIEIPGLVYSRHQIIEAMSTENYIVSERTIDTHIKNIRKKIGDKYIKTIFGIGYKIEDS